MKTTVLIIGGGMSGVTVAYQLAKIGIDTLLLEAKDMLGGRILSPRTGVDTSTGTAAAIDLGPSWFWPDQHNMVSLIEEVGLTKAVYEQSSGGKSVIEYASGSIEQTHGGASMAGSLRLRGGMVALVNQLASTLSPASVLLNTVAQHITLTETGLVTIATSGGSTLEITSQHVVLALPPRLVADSIELQPTIAPDYTENLRSVSTWMAGEAKLVATYEKPFWREQGLSGDGLSQLGPMMEIHDASPDSTGRQALFGFVGIPPDQREHNESLVKQAAVDQITRMFGTAGANPLEVYFKDWAFDSLIATGLDRQSHRAHPNSRAVNRSEWGQRLIWAGSEMAGPNSVYAGYLEGAVESANAVVHMLSR